MGTEQSSRWSVRQIVAAMLVTVAAMLMVVALTGCGAKEESQPASSSKETQTEAQTKTSIPQHTFMNVDGQLVDIYGEVVYDPKEADSKSSSSASSKSSSSGSHSASNEGKDETQILGALAEDCMVKSHVTSEQGKKTHLELIDAQGNTIADLDPVAAKYGDSFEVMKWSDRFADGRFAIGLTYADAHDVTIVIDTEGNEVFSIGDGPNCTVQIQGYSLNYSPNYSDTTYQYGYTDTLVYDDIFDTNGKTVLSKASDVVIGDSLESLQDWGLLGDGFLWGKSQTKKYVRSFAGESIDCESLSTDTMTFSDSSYGCASPVGSNVVLIEGDEKIPNEGNTRGVAGLYNLAEKKWIVEPTYACRPETNGEYPDVYTDGRFLVAFDSKECISGDGTEHEHTGGSSYYCIMDAHGNVVFDLEMLDVTENAPDADKAYFSAAPIEGGYWLVEYPCSNAPQKEAKVLIYFDENGTYAGCVSTNFYPMINYDAYWIDR